MVEGQKYCAIIPAYREGGRIGSVVKDVLARGADAVVVDDGSPDSTAEEARGAGAIVLQLDSNEGKGVALETGFRYAREQGYSFVITMDADGQHDPSDMDALIRAHTAGGFPVVVGSRMWDKGRMPLVRRLTNRFMSWLLSREMGQFVPDTQSGYRLYAREVLGMLHVDSTRFAAESEVLLSLSDAGVKIGSAPIQVIYLDEKSKINPVRDTIRFFSMLADYRRRKRRQPAGGRGD